MQFSANREEMLRALERVVGAVDKRSTIPLLSHVRMDVYLRGAVGFTATDLEVFASSECDARFDGAGGAVCVPADKLKGAIAGADGEDITVRLGDDMRLTIRSEDRRFELACLPVDEYPVLPDLATGPWCNFDDLVSLAFRACGHAVCTDLQKSNLNGLYICTEGDRVTFVATDGHRLSLAGVDYPETAGSLTEGFILPAKAARILAGIPSRFTLQFDDDRRSACFSSNLGDLVARLVDGKFPDYNRVIPTGNEESLIVDGEALAGAIEACGVVEDSGSKAVDLKVEDGQLIVSALSDAGHAVASIPCTDGEGFGMRLNSRYLLQAIKGLGKGEVFLKFKDAMNPVLMVPVDHVRWDKRIEVVMPLKG